MEDMTVVFFYADEKGSGRACVKRRKSGGWKCGKKWQYNIYSTERQIGSGSLKMLCVGLPLLEKEKERTSPAWKQYLEEMPIPPEGRLVYYAPDKKAEKILGRGREPLTIEWILMLAEFYALSFDSLVLIQSREMEAEEIIRHYAAEVAYLGVVENFGADWETVEEELSMEYGLTLDVKQVLTALHIKGKRTLIIAGDEKVQNINAELPKEIIWLSVSGRRKEISPFQDDGIRYVNMETFLRDTVLDTVHKIKYNNTR